MVKLVWFLKTPNRKEVLNEPTGGDLKKMKSNTLKHYRNKRGYTQKKLAWLISTDQSMIQKMESGKRNISENYRMKLVRVLVLPDDYNFEQKDYVKEIVSIYSTLSSDGKNKIMGLVHYLRYKDGLDSRVFLEE